MVGVNDPLGLASFSGTAAVVVMLDDRSSWGNGLLAASGRKQEPSPTSVPRSSVELVGHCC